MHNRYYIYELRVAVHLIKKKFDGKIIELKVSRYFFKFYDQTVAYASNVYDPLGALNIACSFIFLSKKNAQVRSLFCSDNKDRLFVHS